MDLPPNFEDGRRWYYDEK